MHFTRDLRKAARDSSGEDIVVETLHTPAPRDQLSMRDPGAAEEPEGAMDIAQEANSPVRDEKETIASILRGETQLFHELIKPYERNAYLMALSFLHNEADAEDAVQEAFLKAFRHLAGFRGESKFATWLISIVLNEARSRLRHRNVVPMDSLDTDPEDHSHVSPALMRDWREIPSQALERREVSLMLQEAVAGLPQKYRDAFLLRDVEDFSTAEAAELLQISAGSLKVRLHRARTMLQKNLAPKLKQMNPHRRRFQCS
jgi:RNA polymerase sigma-70 factor (ECF subfamily)